MYSDIHQHWDYSNCEFKQYPFFFFFLARSTRCSINQTCLNYTTNMMMWAYMSLTWHESTDVTMTMMVAELKYERSQVS